MQTKSGFEILRIVDIPSTYLSFKILERLKGRESFVDTDEELGEQIFSADVFELIICKQKDFKERGIDYLLLSDEDLKTVNELVKELSEFELVRITRC
jgi:hypothetical protein